MGCTSASCALVVRPAVPATGGTRIDTWAPLSSWLLTGAFFFFFFFSPLPRQLPISCGVSGGQAVCVFSPPFAFGAGYHIFSSLRSIGVTGYVRHLPVFLNSVLHHRFGVGSGFPVCGHKSIASLRTLEAAGQGSPTCDPHCLLQTSQFSVLQGFFSSSPVLQGVFSSCFPFTPSVQMSLIPRARAPACVAADVRSCVRTRALLNLHLHGSPCLRPPC